MRTRAALATLLLPVLSAAAHAQDISAKVTGTVTDPSGAVVANATVTVREVSRGVDTTGTTNASGSYYIGPLGPGNYQLTVQAPGFTTVQHPPFTLVLDQTARIDIAMPVGQESQTVTVSSAPPLLETDQSYLGTVLDAHANVTLPLATRNYNQLTLLSPGAVSTNPGSFTGPQASFQVGRPYINGNREQTNNYLLDGTDNNQIDNNDVAFSPSVDAIQEFNLISQNAPASYGNYLGGVISVTIKSGTNKFHGDVFEFIRNDAFNANTWANGLGAGTSTGVLPTPKLRWNEFGGTLGGPIVKDKVFFFVDYQGSRFDQPGTTNQYTVITAAERQGDFSAVCTAGFTGAGLCNNLAQQLYNPFSGNTPATRQPFLNNRINVPFSAAATKILNSPLYPEPTVGGGATQNNSTNRTQSYTNSDQGDARIDWAINEKSKFYARYSQQNITNPTTNSQLLQGNSVNQFPLYNGVIDYDRTISSTFLNTFRVGGSYFPVTEGPTNPTGQNLPQVFGIAGTAPGQTFLPAQNFSGATYGPGFGNDDLVSEFHDTVLEPQDHVTLIRGKHSLSLGFEYFYYKTNVFYSNAGLAGTFGYDGSFTSNPSVSGVDPTTGKPESSTGWAEADFLLGLPENVALGAGGGRSLRNSLYAGYAQDDWRAAPNLTLNLGLRYEITTPRAEAHNLATNYNLQTGAVEIAGQNGNSKALYNQYDGATNVQPRVGFAWQPNGAEGRTVVRGAYGISNFTESTGTGNLLFQNPPFAIPLNVTYAGVSQALPGSTLDQGFSSFPSSGCTVAAAQAQSPLCFTGTSIHAFAPNGFRPAVSQQWNLTTQFQLNNSSTFQLGYVGQKVDHLASIALINQKVLHPGGVITPSPYLNPTLQSLVGQARLTSSTGFSNYHSLQASFQQRLTHGLQFQANFTWSKCMGNTSGFFAEYGDGNPGASQAGNNHFFFQNTYDPHADYGRCDQNVASSGNGFVTYDLPVGRGRMFGGNMNRALDAAVGGWQANAITTLHSGFPITAEASTDESGTTSGFERADCAGQPRSLGYHKVPGQQGYIWLDNSTVSEPALHTFGNCQVGSFTGPGLQTFDLSLFKSFAVLESDSIQFRAEAINVLNHPILSAPNGNVGNLATFGRISNAQGERNLQFAIKYLF